MIRVRGFEPDDSPALREIFYRAIQQGSAAFYDKRQRDAWARAPEAPPNWTRRLGDQITVVAEVDGARAGFMTMGREGYLDLAFVAPEWMGAGVAAALHDRLLHIALAEGITRLTTEASHLARRFLIRQGWQELAEQQVMVCGVILTNFRMEKRLVKATEVLAVRLES